MLASGLFLAAITAITGSDSLFIRIDVVICFGLALLLFVLDLKRCEPSRPPLTIRGGSSNPNRWRDTALVLSALITIFSPVVKIAVEAGATALGREVHKNRECRAIGADGTTRS